MQPTSLSVTHLACAKSAPTGFAPEANVRTTGDMLQVLQLQSEKVGYNLANSLACARLARLAYDNESGIHEVVRAWGLGKAETIEIGPNFALVYGNEEVIIVAFRGTNERKDFLTDFDFLPMKSPLGCVHRGFMKATLSFWPKLPNVISTLRTQRQRVWLTGHSLGGAIALLATTRLMLRDKQRIDGLHTFGQPPVGTRGFCRNADKLVRGRYFRFVNNVDAIVDAGPPFAEHAGRLKYFDVDGRIHDRKVLWDAMRAPSRESGVEFKAHGMDRYISAIEQVAKDA